MATSRDNILRPSLFDLKFSAVEYTSKHSCKVNQMRGDYSLVHRNSRALVRSNRSGVMHAVICLSAEHYNQPKWLKPTSKQLCLSFLLIEQAVTQAPTLLGNSSRSAYTPTFLLSWHKGPKPAAGRYEIAEEMLKKIFRLRSCIS